MADRTTTPTDTKLILLLDTHQHAYQKNLGAAGAKYIDAFFIHINCDIVAQRM